MVVIFSASGDQNSAQHSSRILGPLLHWLFPNLTPQREEALILLARKGGHLTEYAILGGLAWRLVRHLGSTQKTWQRTHAVYALLIAAAYAATDEWHQRFVPTRQGTLTDVLIDTAGAAAGLFVLWWFGRLRKKW
jgi:VanZ family protein